ncbi:MAG: L-aspartate oxidase [Alphaproteobacteria bacterium]
MSATRVNHDGVLIVGAGLAGLSAALACAPKKALVLAAQPLFKGSSSAWAQGGIAAALGPGDHPSIHAADTVTAGAGLVDASVADDITRRAVAAVERLTRIGAPFDKDAKGHYALNLEAAHAFPRVARAGGDGAGRAIMEAVIAASMADPNIEIRTGVTLKALLQDASGRVRGVLAETSKGLVEFVAPATILATGGLGGLYAVTTNPRELRGEGLAAAALAGAVIADPEFVQFHPTAIDIGADPAPLATETLRGAGAKLIDKEGHPFMAAYHARAELAARDIVARAIHRQRADGLGAFLDAREAVGAAFLERFPAVFAACMAAAIDPRKQPIPVAPAVHYHMGGIAADVHGRTSLPGLFAAGECAATGLHGANRLASNSLLEAAVCGQLAGEAARELDDPRTAPLPASAPPNLPDNALAILREAMSRDAGVIRDEEGLTRLTGVIDELEAEYGRALPLVTARLIADAALRRHESRGGHYRSDFPTTVPFAQHTRLRLLGPATEAA